MISEHDELVIDKEIPSFFDYCCYLMNFIGGLVGPTISYKEYKHFIYNTNKEEFIKKKVIFEKLVSFFIVIVIYLLSIFFWDSEMIKNDNFRNLFFPLKFVFIYIQSVLVRCRYYFPFLLAEFSVCFGNIKSSTENYTKYSTNLNLHKIELQFSVRERVPSWNQGTAKWLKEIIYYQILKIYKISKSEANLFTFFVSALWHGFYPSYYLGFFIANISTQLEKICFKNKNLGFVPIIFFSMILDYAGVVFKCIDVKELWKVMKNTWTVFLFYVVMYFVLMNYPKKMKVKGN